MEWDPLKKPITNGLVAPMKTDLKWLISVVCCFLLISGFHPAQSSEKGLQVLSDTTIFLPVKSLVKMKWVFPPLDPELVREATGQWQKTCFSVDPKGQVWIGYGNQYLLTPLGGQRIVLSESYWNFVHLDNGALVFSTAAKIGMMVSGEKLTTNEKGIPVFPFQPVALLPAHCYRMCKGAGETLFFLCRDAAKRETSIYLLKPEKGSSNAGEHGQLRSYRKIFTTSETVTAVAGDDQFTFIALGKMVVVVSGKTSKVSRLASHPSYEISELVFSPEAGLYYATTGSVGYIGADGVFEFLQTPLPSLFLKGDTLHICFRKNLGVVALENVSELRNQALLLTSSPRTP